MITSFSFILFDLFNNIFGLYRIFCFEVICFGKKFTDMTIYDGAIDVYETKGSFTVEVCAVLKILPLGHFNRDNNCDL